MVAPAGSPGSRGWGSFSAVSARLNADAVVAGASLEKIGTLMVSSSLFGTSRKQSSEVIATTVVDHWNPTRATIDGLGSRLVPPRSVMWWRNRGDSSEAIPMNRMASSSFR